MSRPSRNELLVQYAGAVAADWLGALVDLAREAGVEPNAAEMAHIIFRAAFTLAAGHMEHRRACGDPIPWTNREIQAFVASLAAKQFPAEADRPEPFPRGGDEHAAH